jgi:hypothetical protein
MLDLSYPWVTQFDLGNLWAMKHLLSIVPNQKKIYPSYLWMTRFDFNYLRATRSNIDCSWVAKFNLGYLWPIIIFSFHCSWRTKLYLGYPWVARSNIGDLQVIKFDLGYLNAIGYYLGLS